MLLARRPTSTATAIACALLTLAPAAQGAALIEVDLFSAGDALVTRDRATGLDWLDLPLTDGLSQNDIVTGVGGWSTAGWRHATTSEVCGLYAAAGGPASCPGTVTVPSQQSIDDIDALLSLIGSTYSTGMLALYDDGDGDALIGEAQLDSGGANAIWNLTPDRHFPATAAGTLANFLVRPVPEPGTALMVASGLLVLARRSRRAV